MQRYYVILNLKQYVQVEIFCIWCHLVVVSENTAVDHTECTLIIHSVSFQTYEIRKYRQVRSQRQWPTHRNIWTQGNLQNLGTSKSLLSLIPAHEFARVLVHKYTDVVAPVNIIKLSTLFFSDIPN